MDFVCGDLKKLMMDNKKSDVDTKSCTRRYSKELKGVVVSAIINGELLLEEAMLKYEIEDRKKIIDWLRIYVRGKKNIKKGDGNVRKEKINIKNPSGFDNLITVAMDGDSLFFEKFKKVFPDFCNALKLRYPSIILSDLKFLAYMRLGFNSQQVSLATSVTLGDVRRHKIRLRRKFGILPRVRVCDWITSVSEDYNL